MEWLERLNEALDYLEDNLGGQISLETAAQKACSSVYHFQRMFPYIAGVTLSEYIRRRRLTMAAFDLQNGEKVLDVALRYGYDSPTAFNRAFHAMHGIAPSAAQKLGVTLKAYPRIGFQITIKGETKMDYRIEKKDAFRIVGVRTPLNIDNGYKLREDADEEQMQSAFNHVPAFWQQNGAKIPQILALMNQAPMGLLGATCANSSGESFYYIAAATDMPAPEGMHEQTIPACTWAIFPGNGLPQGIQELMKRIYSEWLPTSGWDWADAPDLEVYLDDNPVDMKYEVWLPIVKKA